ncbi:flagellar hook-associated protein FlgL [Gorillibacterium timonense]|uniref:flagellar hook-associated protein FlgL n=1 Tax=Gorillibacterium timonense TaxID=1689269 RepID=UPI00071D8522|nr:flagellar hook-associated protein FlgL [Gorillibacterium timonense]
MPGRITQNMMNTQLLTNLGSNLNRMNNLQNQMSTSRKINKPSDDPVGLSYSMRYRSELSNYDQYAKNADNAVSWLDYTDTMLGQAGSVLQRIRELTVNAANGTNPEDALKAVQSEVDQLSSQLVDIGNSQFNGKYVFNGELTDKIPYSTTNPEDSVTDSGEIKFQVGAGSQIPININGNAVFGSPNPGENLFGVLKDLSTALSTGDQTSVSSLLGKLDSRLEQMLNVRSDLGAKTNRVELAQDRLNDISINLQSLQSKTEDADMAEVITNLKTQENVYESSLSVGSKLIQHSLIDFLR